MRIPYVSDLLDVIDYNVQNYADPYTRNQFMLWENPIPVWVLTALYLLFVYYGPKYMKNRPAYSFQYFMVIYNLGLVVLSIYMVVEIFLSTSAAGYNWLCSPWTQHSWKDPGQDRVANVLFFYGISKAIELLDTVLMILRKKNNQVTFLHVFHHATMLNIWWWVPTFTPGGQTWFGVCLNCMVHVVMYAYYGLAVIPSLRNKLWWKKYITSFQLIQFVCTFLHSLNTLVTGCDFPLWGQYLLINYMLIMLILFGNFYVKQYIQKRSPSKVHPKKNDSVSNGYTNISTNQNTSYEMNGNYTEGNGHTNGVSHRH